MNQKNHDMIFNDEETSTIVTLTDENGNDIEAEVFIAIEIEELGKEYVAAMPLNGDFEEGEVVILEYREYKNGDPEFLPIEDEEEFEIASQIFNQYFEDLDTEEMEDDAEEIGDYMDEVESMIPGITFKRD